MENKVLEHFKTYVNKPFPTNPSATSKWLQGILRDVNEDEVIIAYTVREEMTNPIKTIHGGMISLFIDESIGVAVFIQPTKNVYVSVNLTVDFLKSAQKDDEITAHAQIIRRGNTIIHAECRLYNNKNELIAIGTSNLVRTAIPKQKILQEFTDGNSLTLSKGHNNEVSNFHNK